MGPERGQVRVLSADGALWGAGVLAMVGEAGLHVLTCAHVVTAAGAEPDGDLVVDLYGRGWSARARSLPEAWSPTPPLGTLPAGASLTDMGDFAALRLEAGHPPLPRGCGPLPLLSCGAPLGRQVAIIGYPHGTVSGLIATARMVGSGGPCPDWVQLDGLRTTGATVEHGFSGAAVWDPAVHRVVGLVTAAHTDRTAKVGWMLPVTTAVRLWPPLATAVRSAAPSRCRPPAPEARYRVADALLEVPQIEHDSGEALREALPPAIRRNIRKHPYPRQQLQAVVQACTDYEGGCAALRAAVLNVGGETASALRAVEIFNQVCCSGTEEDT
ncbi:Trypsin-like peptidase domain-containing protein [Nonomuraea solani]|uniref:Trypsin-like peptidase domain-containing protein n=1 Tax=Nonomuraea solani TaxID=1144553 RepID=A0A1H6DU47_9ACTN|nr:trypsin-like peptidase domain-containing protein [Nonomuraea solani]SEG88226.1 Trypsin-like peptidase domain-containing protein [Nonomuraea solani]